MSSSSKKKWVLVTCNFYEWVDSSILTLWESICQPSMENWCCYKMIWMCTTPPLLESPYPNILKHISFPHNLDCTQFPTHTFFPMTSANLFFLFHTSLEQAAGPNQWPKNCSRLLASSTLTSSRIFRTCFWWLKQKQRKRKPSKNWKIQNRWPCTRTSTASAITLDADIRGDPVWRNQGNLIPRDLSKLNFCAESIPKINLLGCNCLRDSIWDCLGFRHLR